MRNLFTPIVLAIVLYAYFAEATSEPVCQHKPTGKFLRRGETVINFKEPTGCVNQITCTSDYEVNVKECGPELFPADKPLKNDEFPDCCFL